LKTYETDDKYKGLEEYEWNTTQTRQEKEIERRKKAAYAERLRLRKEQD
jgi:colicin import membrane protein